MSKIDIACRTEIVKAYNGHREDGHLVLPAEKREEKLERRLKHRPVMGDSFYECSSVNNLDDLAARAVKVMIRIKRSLGAPGKIVESNIVAYNVARKRK